MSASHYCRCRDKCATMHCHQKRLNAQGGGLLPGGHAQQSASGLGMQLMSSGIVFIFDSHMYL